MNSSKLDLTFIVSILVVTASTAVPLFAVSALSVAIGFFVKNCVTTDNWKAAGSKQQ